MEDMQLLRPQKLSCLFTKGEGTLPKDGASVSCQPSDGQYTYTENFQERLSIAIVIAAGLLVVHRPSVGRLESANATVRLTPKRTMTTSDICHSERPRSDRQLGLLSASSVKGQQSRSNVVR